MIQGSNSLDTVRLPSDTEAIAMSSVARPVHFCRCVRRRSDRLHRVDDMLCCNLCGYPIECEFSDDDGDFWPLPHAAEVVHIDYIVCWMHLNIAVDNVASRWC